MDKLSQDMKDIIDMIKLFLSRKDVLQLIQILMEHYGIKAQELGVAKEKVEEPKAQETTDEESFKIIPCVGVILPSGKLLFYDGSQDKGSKYDAQRYIAKLPKGYDWHLMTKTEFDECKACQPHLNATLRKMGGLPIIYLDSSYLLADNNLQRGYVRYCADYV